MLLIIIFSSIVFINLLLLIVFSVKFIFKILKKEKILKKNVITIVILFLSLILFGTIDGIFIARHLYKNRDAILKKTSDVLTSSVKYSSEILFQGVSEAFVNVEKKWDDKEIILFKNIDVSLKSFSVKKINNSNKITLNVLFDNQNTKNNKVELYKILYKNYLILCDKEDICYPLTGKERDQYYIPQGKSLIEFKITLPANIKIEYLRYINKTIKIKNK